jgi:hypothetical protein
MPSISEAHWKRRRRKRRGEQKEATARANGLASISEATNAPTMISDLEGWLDRVRA